MAERKTRCVQGAVSLWTCGFKSHSRHQLFRVGEPGQGLATVIRVYTRACSSVERALPCGGRGRGFESRQARHFRGSLTGRPGHSRGVFMLRGFSAWWAWFRTGIFTPILTFPRRGGRDWIPAFAGMTVGLPGAGFRNTLEGATPTLTLPLIGGGDFLAPIAQSCRLLLVDAVDAGGGVVKHGGALGGGVVLGQPLEGVVHDVVRVGNLVHREVALEHTAVGARIVRCNNPCRGPLPQPVLRNRWGGRVRASRSRCGVMPMPPSFMLTLGHWATAAMPLRHWARTSSSRLA